MAVPAIRKSRQEATVTVLGWLKALPDELVHVRPVLSVGYAFALLAGGELEGVEARLRDAERWLDTTAELRERPESPAAGMVVVDEEEFRRLPGMIALIRAAQALARGDMPETVKNARRVLDLAPEDDYLMLGGAASTAGARRMDERGSRHRPPDDCRWHGECAAGRVHLSRHRRRHRPGGYPDRARPSPRGNDHL